MSEYTPTIRSMTEGQRLRLLTDMQSLAEPWAIALGVPQVRLSFLGEDFEDLPAPALLARSWDPALLREATADVARRLAARGTNHGILPPVGAFTAGSLSEDPCLTGLLEGAMLAGACEGGLTASLSLGDSTPLTAGVGEAMARRGMREHIAEPCAALTRCGTPVGAVMETNDPAPAGLVAGGYPILRRQADGKETILALSRGEILIRGSEPALREALYTYRRLQEAIARGQTATGELEAAVLAGEAISDEAVEAALERLFSFAASARSGAVCDGGFRQEATLLSRALEGATVLLENPNGLLPLERPTRVCILGEPAREEWEAMAEALTRRGHTFAGYARGYDPAREREDALRAEAVELATRADTVLILVETPAGEGTLPVSCLSLLWEVSRLGKQAVVVLSSDVTPDVGFLRLLVTPVAGLLLAPLSARGGAVHAVETLLGERAPLGRLTETLVDRADPAACRQGFPVGLFVGYRYYDTLGCGSAYPFGYGLGYTEFRYSAMSVAWHHEGDAAAKDAIEGTVTFTVLNCGKRAGAAIPQVYLGIKRSAVLRPRKELVSCKHIFLEPGERVTVTLPWRLPLADAEGGVERGLYRLYLGESVSDIRLSADFPGGRDEIPVSGEELSRYLPSVTNIQTERYVLEAEYTPMKPSLRNLICGIAALCLAVSLKIYDVLTSSDSLFLDIVAGILALGAAAFFVLDLLDRRKTRAEELARIEQANAELFCDAVTVSMPTAERLFEEDGEEEAPLAEPADEAPAYDHFADVDTSMTLTDALQDLRALARERGLAVEEATLRSILAAMAASRLVVLRGMGEPAFEALVACLGAYFLCPAEVDKADESYLTEADVLVAANEAGERQERGVLRALRAAAAEPGRIHLASITGVDPETVSRYIVPFTRYARAPLSEWSVSVQDEAGESLCRIPQNVWILLNLKEDAPLGALPEHVLEVATVHAWLVEPGAPSMDEPVSLRRFSYGQMEYFREELRKEQTAEETVWKQIDALEAYAGGYAPFRIGNRRWLAMELYTAALTTMGVAPAAALDEAIAVKLMPSLVGALAGRIPRGERGLGETLDALLGEENTALCRRALKSAGADIR